MVPTRRRLFAGITLLLVTPTSFAAIRRDRALDVPPGYVLIANELGIPAALLYGVALQESMMQFGESQARRPLPWPWTLNIAGTPVRFASRSAAEERLRSSLRVGVDSVDIGPMGINWHYHKDRLISVERSLEPYWNLRVGAGLLAGHFVDCNDWSEAVGRYHSPGNKAHAASYSASVFARLRRLGHV
jgi:hypothetical protein